MRKSKACALVGGYLAAISAVAIAFVVRLLLDPYLGPRAPLFMFLMAVVAVAWFGSLGPSILAGILGYFVGDYFFDIPRYTWTFVDVGDAISVVTYFVLFTFIVLFGHIIRSARRQAIIHRDEMARELAERTAAQESLASSEERLRLTTEAAEVGTWDWDLVGNDLKWGDQASRLLGLPTDTPKSYEVFFSRVHPEDVPKVRTSVEEAIHRHAYYSVEFRAMHDDGSIHWILACGRAIYDDSGRPVRMTGTAQCITALKQAQEAVQRSEERFRRLAEATFEGIAIIHHGKYVDINDQLAGMLKYRREELIGQPIARFVRPPDRARIMHNISRGLESHLDHPMLCKDGSAIYVETHGKPFPYDSSTRFTAIRDITAYKQAQDALVKARNELEDRVQERTCELQHRVRAAFPPGFRTDHGGTGRAAAAGAGAARSSPAAPGRHQVRPGGISPPGQRCAAGQVGARHGTGGGIDQDLPRVDGRASPRRS